MHPISHVMVVLCTRMPISHVQHALDGCTAPNNLSCTFPFEVLNSIHSCIPDYNKAWSAFIDSAFSRNVSKLIYDVTGNNGGDIVTGHYGFASMYPAVTKRGNTYPWLLVFQRRFGPALLAMKQAGLLPSSGMIMYQLGEMIIVKVGRCM